MSTPDETATVITPREYRGNMMVLNFGYDFQVIVTMEIGAQILSLLSQAELFENPYQKEQMIKPMNKDLSIRLLSITEYERLKISFILNGGKDGDD